MDTLQKIDAVVSVARGESHPSTLKDLLPEADSNEPNFIQIAIEGIVSERLQAVNEGAVPRFRLRLEEPSSSGETEEIETEVEDLDGSKRKVKAKVFKPKVSYTDWHSETDPRLSVPRMVTKVRERHPNAAITVEWQ